MMLQQQLSGCLSCSPAWPLAMGHLATISQARRTFQSCRRKHILPACSQRKLPAGPVHPAAASLVSDSGVWTKHLPKNLNFPLAEPNIW